MLFEFILISTVLLVSAANPNLVSDPHFKTAGKKAWSGDCDPQVELCAYEQIRSNGWNLRGAGFVDDSGQQKFVKGTVDIAPPNYAGAPPDNLDHAVQIRQGSIRIILARSGELLAAGKYKASIRFAANYAEGCEETQNAFFQVTLLKEGVEQKERKDVNLANPVTSEPVTLTKRGRRRKQAQQAQQVEAPARGRYWSYAELTFDVTAGVSEPMFSIGTDTKGGKCGILVKEALVQKLNA
jgi:hypothetical protein